MQSDEISEISLSPDDDQKHNKFDNFRFQLKNNLYEFVVAATDSVGLEKSQERIRVFVRRVWLFRPIQPKPGLVLVVLKCMVSIKCF